MKNISHVEIDDIDRILLDALAENARITNADLAERAGIAQSTCITRVRNLVKQGVIEGFHARISPAALGNGMQVLISVTLRASARQQLSQFMEEMRFKAAGDAIYAAKGEQIQVENTEFSANLAVKLELLAEAEKTVKPEKNLAEAKKTLAAIQAKWEKAGKVPREKVREVEDRLKAVEAKVRQVEQEEWRKTDPAAIERTNSVLSQLEDSIVKLEENLKAAKAKKDAKATKEAEEALAARKAWLEIVKKAQ